ncbi:DUF6283 family protein [Nocardia asteroides]|uniref:DUF6283 family protein n=1 Tax=Nocardia asteroides TaxID=1824 RepID=UPI00340E5022
MVLDEMGPPAPRPCASCPYRRDVPSGVWDYAEYEKLRAYDGEMGEQPQGLFQCHQADGDSPASRMCAGWVGCHGGHELLALRLALIGGRIQPETFEAAERYVSPVALFGSGAEAADHGQAEIDRPGVQARRLIQKIDKVRTDLSPLEPGARRQPRKGRGPALPAASQAVAGGGDVVADCPNDTADHCRPE